MARTALALDDNGLGDRIASYSCISTKVRKLESWINDEADLLVTSDVEHSALESGLQKGNASCKPGNSEYADGKRFCKSAVTGERTHCIPVSTHTLSICRELRDICCAAVTIAASGSGAEAASRTM